MISPWKKLGSKALADFSIFRVRSDQRLSPRTRQEHSFYVIDCAPWVNVIALTPDLQIVMVEQFRHGTETIELEIPGGMIDPEDASPVAAGVRELREETGYTGEQARIIGEIYPNPAIMSNTCYTVLVERCAPTHACEFDHGEDILTRLTPVDQVSQLVASGCVRHSLVAVALYHFELWRRGLGPA